MSDQPVGQVVLEKKPKTPSILEYLVLDVRTQAPDVFELFVQKPEGFHFRPGQFMSVVIPGAGPGGRDLRRAYSIASFPEEEPLRFSIKKVEGGPGTTYLSKLVPGDRFRGQAPFGDYVLHSPLEVPVVFVSTGTGIAPHRSMILSKEWQQQASLRGPVAYLLGVRHEEDILYPELFDPQQELSSSLRSSAHCVVTCSRPKNSPKSSVDQQATKGPRVVQGRVTDYMKQTMKDWPWGQTHFYLCGSGPMIQEVSQWAIETLGLSSEQIHKEAYFK